MGDVGKAVGNEISNNEVLIVSVSSKDYRSATSDIVEFTKSMDKPCYITLNDPSDIIRPKAGNNICFIDCVTATVKKPEHRDDVIYVSSPRALTEISIAVKKAMEGFKMDFVVFDSLSALLVYEKSVGVMKFVHNLILMFRENKKKVIFIILKEDVSEELMKDLSMFVDKVVEV